MNDIEVAVMALNDQQRALFMRWLCVNRVGVIREAFRQYQREQGSEEHAMRCGQRIWPYTENNVCVLRPGHESRLHKDARGREFEVGGYIKERKSGQ